MISLGYDDRRRDYDNNAYDNQDPNGKLFVLKICSFEIIKKRFSFTCRESTTIL